MGDVKTEKQAQMVKRKEKTPIRPLWQRVLAMVLIIIIFAVGMGIAKYLMDNKPQTRKHAPQKAITPVKVIALQRSDSFIRVSGIGTVIAAKTVNLQAQVSGRTIYVNSKLIPGSIIKKGETIIKIDASDYEIQKRLKKSALDKAMADLAIEKGQQAIAAEEWQLVKEFADKKNRHSMAGMATASDLVLRKPHLDKIKAVVASAKAELEQVVLNLQRTTVKAPFNAIVSEKNIAPGSQISTQTTIAKLVGVDEYWVEILIPAGKLPYLNISFNNLKDLPEVKLTYTGNNNSTVYKGKILKLSGHVDTKGLMANILVLIKDPLGLKSNHSPLLLGSSVKAEITGRQLNGYFKIPRAALLDSGKIMVAGKENTLEIRDVAVEWRSKEWVYIKNRIKENEKLIISRLAAPVPGMQVKIISSQKK